MEDALRSFLVELSKDQPEQLFAILRPESASPPLWKLVWASQADTSVRLVGRLTPGPEAINWPGQPGALGMALISRLGPLGVVTWPRPGSGLAPEGLLEALEACREIYWEECEQKWMSLMLSLLIALKEQRRELGSAIHRGPAQSLTAARLELSMMGEAALKLPLAQALEQASDELVRLVHGKLYGRGKDGTLEGTLRGELDFQARWRDLPSGESTVTLPRDNLSTTLLELWKLAGCQVEDGAENPTFVLGGKP